MAPPPPQQAVASSLLWAGPPASIASVLRAFGCSFGTLPLATGGSDLNPVNGRRIDARLPTFRARAAARAHAVSTPDAAWPVSGYPPGSSREENCPSVSTPSDVLTTLQQRPPTRLDAGSAASGSSSRTPPDAVSPRILPAAHHDRLQPTQDRVVWRLPPQADAEGPSVLHLLHSIASMRNFLHDSSFSVRGARSRHPQGHSTIAQSSSRTDGRTPAIDIAEGPIKTLNEEYVDSTGCVPFAVILASPSVTPERIVYLDGAMACDARSTISPQPSIRIPRGRPPLRSSISRSIACAPRRSVGSRIVVSGGLRNSAIG